MTTSDKDCLTYPMRLRAYRAEQRREQEDREYRARMWRIHDALSKMDNTWEARWAMERILRR